MVLRTRKLVVVGAIAAVFFLANALVIVTWLNDAGVFGWARSIRSEFVTGTAITVIAALVILLPAAGVRAHARRDPHERCPVCDGALRPGGKYCPACGSRV